MLPVFGSASIVTASACARLPAIRSSACGRWRRGREYTGASSVGHRGKHSAAAHERFRSRAPHPLSETPLLPTRASRRGTLDLTHPVFR